MNGQNSRKEISQLGIFSSEDTGKSKVYINQDASINEIIIAKAQTQKDNEIWSVQIYMGSGKNARAVASSTMGSYRAKYGEPEPRLLYPTPYFKVLVGNFKTRLEAESFRHKISGDYPNARIELVASSKEK